MGVRSRDLICNPAYMQTGFRVMIAVAYRPVFLLLASASLPPRNTIVRNP